ncbi:SusC/RagA family TonB-linked outer membrane protein [Sinomicrobium sp. M5D2P9]
MKPTLWKLFFLWTMVLTPIGVMAQGEISGTVRETGSGLPLPGVNVVVKGTTTGTVTDFDGNFQISVNTFPATLVFSSLGYKAREQEVTGATEIHVEMEEDVMGLEEVVVTGLGTSIKRSNLANAVSTVSSEELVGTTAQTTLDGALYGKLTGVNITSSSGAPGGGIALRLRGISSIIGNNQPLYIVDGVYINNAEIPSGLRFASGANQGNEENSSNRIADLDPNDIENIEVLKGASAAAIYGTRANAGVVIITTKRGKSGKTKIQLSQDTGFNTIIKKLGMRNWTAERVEGDFGASERSLYENAIATTGLFDYEDVIYGEQGLISDTRLSASGGNEKTNFYIGTSYRDEDGIIKRTGFERFSLRTNIDHQISKTFSISSSSNYIRSSSSRSFTGNENDGGLSYGYNMSFTRPWINLFPDEEGNYPDNPNAAGNPVFVRDKASNEDKNNRFIQALKVTTNLYNGNADRVRVILNGGVDFLANETNVYVPETHQAQRGGQNGFIGVGKNNFTNYNFQGVAVWNHDAMNGDLGITTQAGITYLEQQADIVYNQATQLTPGQTVLTHGTAQAITQTKSTVKEFGYFFQTEGNYKDMFIATFGYRLDKSTLNGDVNKFYGFPKASMAVNLHNFDFWSSSALFSQLKLRAAYGETGSSAAFGSTFISLNPISIGGNGGLTIAPLKGDPNIKPETSAEFEVGFDTQIANKVNIEVTYYNRKVRDLLLTRALPTSSGFGTETTNLADLVNQGVEVALRSDIFRTTDFSWDTGVQFWLNRSEVTRLGVPAFPLSGAGFGLGLGSFYIEEGKPVTQLVGNVDGAPTQVGNVEPDFQMSFTNQLAYKQWNFSFLLHWKQGGENLNLSKYLSDLGRVTPDLNSPSGQERISMGAIAPRFIEPAGYLRLREIALYYTIPGEKLSLLDKAISSIKLGVSARNLFTVTDYSSYDPETSVNGGAGLSSGLEVAPFPSSKQFYFHLNVNF